LSGSLRPHSPPLPGYGRHHNLQPRTHRARSARARTRA
jgi:hypothetical protein